MARIAGVNIPTGKRVVIALQYIHGIGPKTAARLDSVGIKTVEQFLDCDPDELALELNTRHIDDRIIRTWQTQTSLACQIPGIAGHDAQIMVACGFETPKEVASADPETILSLVDEFAKTSEAKFIIRNSNPPDLKEVNDWIEEPIYAERAGFGREPAADQLDHQHIGQSRDHRFAAR